ncbi:hypothetical protein IWX80_002671 [Flavobacterium sp. CAN_S2]
MESYRKVGNLDKLENIRQHTLQAIWVLGFPEVSGGKLVLYLG